MAIKEKLFDQFPPVTTAEWMGKIHSDLKGADFDRKLVWKIDEGFDVMPFYRSEDIEELPFIGSMPGEFPYVRGNRKNDNNWLVRQDIEVSDYLAANSKALDILMKGIDSLGFIIKDPRSISVENFRVLLRNIHPGAVELNFISDGKAKEILEILTTLLREKGLSRTQLTGAVEADPLGRLMVNGTLCVPVEEGFDYLATLTTAALDFPSFRTIHIKASAIADAGGDQVQELAFALSMGNEYMSQLTDRGLSAEEAASKIRFSFASVPEYFPAIARLRAARLLWSLIQKGYGNHESPSARMVIHSVTALWNKTVYDPYVNMLRTQAETMSSVLGGADSITVRPFDAAIRQPDGFSERIARNQQLILREEAGFGKVIDPAAGSWYIEKLTSLIAEHAWELYIETEREGGFIEALRKGYIQDKVSLSASRKRKDFATRKKTLLGTNQYPQGKETLPDAADEKIISGSKPAATAEIRPLVPFRASEEYDKLRMAVESSGRKPVVFLLTIGNAVMRRARAQFSAVFFECAGYRIIDNTGFGSVEEGTEAAMGSGADIVVICSSDEEYLQFAPEIYRHLKDKFIVVIAGNPACSEELKEAGIENFIHVRSDVPAMLRDFNNKMGIEEEKGRRGEGEKGRMEEGEIEALSVE
jgi:methylmalonyl-CoA mutase